LLHRAPLGHGTGLRLLLSGEAGRFAQRALRPVRGLPAGIDARKPALRRVPPRPGLTSLDSRGKPRAISPLGGACPPLTRPHTGCSLQILARIINPTRLARPPPGGGRPVLRPGVPLYRAAGGL